MSVRGLTVARTFCSGRESSQSPASQHRRLRRRRKPQHWQGEKRLGHVYNKELCSNLASASMPGYSVYAVLAHLALAFIHSTTAYRPCLHEVATLQAEAAHASMASCLALTLSWVSFFFSW